MTSSIVISSTSTSMSLTPPASPHILADACPESPILGSMSSTSESIGQMVTSTGLGPEPETISTFTDASDYLPTANRLSKTTFKSNQRISLNNQSKQPSSSLISFPAAITSISITITAGTSASLSSLSSSSLLALKRPTPTLPSVTTIGAKGTRPLSEAARKATTVVPQGPIKAFSPLTLKPGSSEAPTSTNFDTDIQSSKPSSSIVAFLSSSRTLTSTSDFGHPSLSFINHNQAQEGVPSLFSSSPPVNKLSDTAMYSNNNSTTNTSVLRNPSMSSAGGNALNGSSSSGDSTFASSATTATTTTLTSTLLGNGSNANVGGTSAGMSDLKLRRFLEQNQRLKEQLDMNRIPVSEASQ
ncbi:hypothetical protein BX616_005542, partial [Lobosporangium transversale]